MIESITNMAESVINMAESITNMAESITNMEESIIKYGGKYYNIKYYKNIQSFMNMRESIAEILKVL